LQSYGKRTPHRHKAVLLFNWQLTKIFAYP
jgi:hypothetical protein